MMVGIGVSLMITGILAYTVVDNLKPECKPWKRNVINAIIVAGAVLTLSGYFV